MKKQLASDNNTRLDFKTLCVFLGSLCVALFVKQIDLQVKLQEKGVELVSLRNQGDRLTNQIEALQFYYKNETLYLKSTYETEISSLKSEIVAAHQNKPEIRYISVMYQNLTEKQKGEDESQIKPVEKTKNDFGVRERTIGAGGKH
jgi:predicted  nucleic acid-binding Zn-ribbon protein